MDKGEALCDTACKKGCRNKNRLDWMYSRRVLGLGLLRQQDISVSDE